MKTISIAFLHFPNCLLQFALCLLPFILRGQGLDTHISQFWMNTARFNPALTGVTDNDVRFMGLFRSQDHATLGWSSDYQSIMAAFDGRIKLNNQKYSARETRDCIGWGIDFMTAQAGDLDTRTTQAHISGSFAKRLTDNNLYLRLGGRIGYVQNGLDLGRARWGSQGHNDGTFDPNIIPYDKAILLQNTLPNWIDMSVGVTLSQSFTDTEMKQGIGGGAAIYHLSRPYVTTLKDEKERVYLRYVFHGAYENRRKNAWGGNVKALATVQNKSLEMLIGGNFVFDFGDNVLQMGTWTRLNNKFHPDAIIPVLRLDVKNFALGVSYDFNIFTNFPSAETLRGLEVTFVCRFAGIGISCPDWKGYNFTF